MNETLTTGQVADHAGVNLQTIRYYERKGLLPKPPRGPSGYRQYSGDHVSRVRFIKRAQELGFTLSEVAELLSLRADPAGDRMDVRRRTVAKMREIDEKISDLTRMRETLSTLANACSGHGSTDDCPIIQALDLEA